MGVSNDALFYSRAFIRGFSDKKAGRAFDPPEDGGPLAGKFRSAHFAYERGRQFAVLWGDRPVSNLTAMKDALLKFHQDGLIL